MLNQFVPLLHLINRVDHAESPLLRQGDRLDDESTLVLADAGLLVGFLGLAVGLSTGGSFDAFVTEGIENLIDLFAFNGQPLDALDALQVGAESLETSRMESAGLNGFSVVAGTQLALEFGGDGLVVGTNEDLRFGLRGLDGSNDGFQGVGLAGASQSVHVRVTGATDRPIHNSLLVSVKSHVVSPTISIPQNDGACIVFIENLGRKFWPLVPLPPVPSVDSFESEHQTSGTRGDYKSFLWKE